MDPMDIDLTIDVLDTPERLTARRPHGITHAEDENHSPTLYQQRNDILKEGSRDQPVFIDSGSRGRAPHPSKYFGSSNLSTASSSSRKNVIFGRGITGMNPTHPIQDSIHHNYQDSFEDLAERNNGRPGLANLTSLLGRTSFRTAREEMDSVSELGSSNGFGVGNNIQEKSGNGGFLSRDPVVLPRKNKQNKFVKNGCISPNYNMSKAKQLVERDSDISVASAHNNNGSNASSAPPNSIDIRELVADDSDSSYTRKGKGVITHPCSSKELDSKNKNLQSRRSISFNEKAVGPICYNKGAGKSIEVLSGWRSTHNRSKDINIASPDEDLHVIRERPPLRYSSQHHDNRSRRREKGASASNRDGIDPKLISSEHDCPQPLKESVPHQRTRLGRFNGTRSTASTLMKRQKQGSTSSTHGQYSTSASDDQEVVSLNSPAEVAYSRSTSRNVGNINIEVDEVSPQLRRDARDEDVRARQLEADERLARELQEQFYNEAPVLGREVDEHIALALQHQDDSDNEFDQTSHPILNERLLIPSLRRQSQAQTSSSALRRGSLARYASLGRMTRQRSCYPVPARASLFPEDMDIEMRMQILGALEEFNDIGMSASMLQVPRDFNENDYEMLLALDDNNDQHSGASARVINGLSQSTVQSEKFDETCVVCLETPTIGEIIRHLPCLHKFHKDCIDPWLRRRTSCPVCKSSVT